MNETIKKDKEYKLNLLKKIKEENEKFAFYFIFFLQLDMKNIKKLEKEN